MMMKFIAINLSILILFSSISFATDDTTYILAKSKKKYEQKNNVSDLCESTSGAGQQECAQKKFETADKKLNAIYKALLTKLPEAEGTEGGETRRYPRKGLIEAQRVWIKYRDANCEFVGDISGGAPIWRHVYEMYCRAEMTEVRAKELQKYLDE